MYETVKHIYKNALKYKNSTNAEEFNLERSAPPAQKWIALFNKNVSFSYYWFGKWEVRFWWKTSDVIQNTHHMNS